MMTAKAQISFHKKAYTMECDAVYEGGYYKNSKINDSLRTFN